MPWGPRCFIIIGEISSGPMALEFFDFFIAFIVCSTVMAMSGLEDFFLIFLRSFLNSLVGLVVAPGVYWELNFDASFFGSL